MNFDNFAAGVVALWNDGQFDDLAKFLKEEHKEAYESLPPAEGYFLSQFPAIWELLKAEVERLEVVHNRKIDGPYSIVRLLRFIRESGLVHVLTVSVTVSAYVGPTASLAMLTHGLKAVRGVVLWLEEEIGEADGD